MDSVLQDLADSGALLLASPAVDRGGRPGRPARRFALDPSERDRRRRGSRRASVTCLVSDAVGTVLARTTVPAETETISPPPKRPFAAPVMLRNASASPCPASSAADGRIAQSLALPDLVGRDLAAELAQRLGAEVVVENDIKLAALAERHLGPPAESIAYVQIGHRISLALILDGRILQGSHRLAGELGSQRGMRWTSRRTGV